MPRLLDGQMVYDGQTVMLSHDPELRAPSRHWVAVDKVLFWGEPADEAALLAPGYRLITGLHDGTGRENSIKYVALGNGLSQWGPQSDLPGREWDPHAYVPLESNLSHLYFQHADQELGATWVSLVAGASSAASSTSVIERLFEFVNLEQGWDGQGASPISRKVAARALAVSLAASLAGFGDLFVAPAQDGSVLLRWSLPNDTHAELFVEETPDFEEMAFIKDGSVFSAPEVHSTWDVIRALRRYSQA